jgi:hypothetical protein
VVLIYFFTIKISRIMIANLPIFLSVFFGLTTILTVFLFAKATATPPQYMEHPDTFGKTALGILLGWAVLQMCISLTGFYQKTDTIPPRLFLGVAPTLLAIAALFFTEKGKNFIESLDLKALTYLHTVRIPVELTLFWLFQNGQIPEVMTFEGRNFDILAGITAPFIAYFGFTKKSISTTLILVWNFICLGLLLNIVIHAILSIESPIQQMAFEQPNRAVLFFPFSCLPTVIVPLVLLAHLVVINRLLKK